MSAKTKIIVVKAKELIYTALFICLAIILILLLIFMFAPGEKSVSTSAGAYTPGVYTSTITLGDTALDVAVSVDENHITSVSLNNLSESVTAMYPLLEPSLESINEQLGATILMVTHDSFSASYAKRILFLRDGEIFTEIRRGSASRKEFFDRILDVLTMMGGGPDAVL